MIIDIHRHLVDKGFYADIYWKSFAKMALPILKRMGVDADIEMIINNIVPVYLDTDGEKHIAAMEEAGIDKTVMLLFDTGLLIGEGTVSIEEQNEMVFAAAKKYPEKIIPFVSIDPRRPNAAEFVKKAVEEYGAKGLKMHPGSGFNPEDKETMNLVGSIADYGIPVLVHTGASIAPTMSKYCDPIYLDKMLLEFPEVKFIAAHMSYGHRQQLFSLGMNRPNLYTDLAAWQTTAKDRFHEFSKVVKDAVIHFGPERVLFGTDNPYLWPVLPEPGYVQVIKDLATKPPEEERLTKEEVDMILGENAMSILSL
jgi:uncharacterized protein